MVRCEGRPNGPCPSKANNNSVKNSQGDLFLCKECENYRFPSKKPAVTGTVTTSDPPQLTTVTKPDVALPPVLDTVQQALPEPKLVVSEVLFFINNKCDHTPRQVMHSTVAEFFNEDEIMAAKQLLVQHMDSHLSGITQPLLKKRIGEYKVDRTIDDILSIFSAIDENGARGFLPVFCAVSLSRVPVVPDKVSEMAVVKAELAALKQQVSILVNSLTQSPADKETLPSKINLSSQNIDPATSCGIISAQPATFSAAVKSTAKFVSQEPVTTVSVPPSHNEDFTAQNADFQTAVNKRHRRRNKLITGCRPETEANSFQGVRKKAVICVSRLDQNTSCDAVSDYLTANGITVNSCYNVGSTQSTDTGSTADDDEANFVERKHHSESSIDDDDATSVKRKSRNYITLRVCVFQADLKKVLCPELWPDGVTVRPWVFKPRQSDQNEH